MSDHVEQALATRRSMRGFLPAPVPRAVVERLLELAARAASNTNTQPWRVHVLTGAARQRFCEAIVAAHFADDFAPEQQYQYAPTAMREPYLSRRRKVGWDLYGLLGIAKGDRAATKRQHARNYEFFGAPVGMIFTVPRGMGEGAWIDLGMFLQGLMIAARGHGLDTCPQAAFVSFHHLICPLLGVPDDEIMACGMALGHADPDEPANTLVTEREPVSGFTTFHGDWPDLPAPP